MRGPWGPGFYPLPIASLHCRVSSLLPAPSQGASVLAERSGGFSAWWCLAAGGCPPISGLLLPAGGPAAAVCVGCGVGVGGSVVLGGRCIRWVGGFGGRRGPGACWVCVMMAGGCCAGGVHGCCAGWCHVTSLLGCPFDGAWCLVCELCRLAKIGQTLAVVCVGCRCSLSCVLLGGARRLGAYSV